MNTENATSGPCFFRRSEAYAEEVYQAPRAKEASGERAGGEGLPRTKSSCAATETSKALMTSAKAAVGLRVITCFF